MVLGPDLSDATGGLGPDRSDTTAGIGFFGSLQESSGQTRCFAGCIHADAMLHRSHSSMTVPSPGKQSQHDSAASSVLRLAAAICETPVAVMLQQEAPEHPGRIIGFGLASKGHKALARKRGASPLQARHFLSDAPGPPRSD